MKTNKYLEGLIHGLQERTEYSMDLFGIEPISYAEAEKVVRIANKVANQLPFLDINEQLENELICQTLRSRGHEEYANMYSLVGIPVENLINTISGSGFEAKENANLQNNAETSHKKGADDLFKKFYLKLLPIKIKKMHENGDLHIHDLEYFGTRPFCIPKEEIVLIRREGKITAISPQRCKLGDELYTPDGWNKIKFITQREYKGDLITLTTARGGIVTTTTEHRIPTTAGIKQCQEIQKGDELLSVDTLSFNKNPSYSEEISEAKALFLGSYIADGHSICNDGYYVIVSDKSSLVERIVKKFADEEGYYVGISKYPDKCPQYGIYKKRLYFELIEKYGINTGSSNKSLPKNIFDMSLERQKDIIASMFYGDGSVFYQPDKSSLTVYYRTTSVLLAKQLGLWLTLNGISYRIRKNPPVNNGNYDVYTIDINVSGLDKMRFLGEQRETIDEYLSNTKQIERKKKENIVVSIERESYEGDVYDFGLEGPNEDINKHMFLAGSGVYIRNCFDWDLRYFFYYGLMPDGNGTKASVSGPAMHPEVAVLHAVKALGSAQTNFAGGQGYYNFLTFLAPYFHKLPYNKIKQLMQMFVFEMTQMMVARGGQLVFSSVQLSPGVPKLWQDKPVVAFGKCFDGKGKKEARWEYGELEVEVRLMFMALMEVFLQGDYWGKPFTFPKPEIVLDREFVDDLDKEFTLDELQRYESYGIKKVPTFRDLYLKAFELSANTGSPYFDNCIPNYRSPMGGEGISCYQSLKEGTLTIVKEKKGLKLAPIEDIENYESIWTPSGFKPVEELLKHKCLKGLKKFSLSGGRIVECTGDHIIPVIRDGKETRKRARDIRIKDRFYIQSDLPEDGILDREVAYLLGLYTAEGYILIRPGNNFSERMQFSFGPTEQNLVDRVVNIFEKFFGVAPKVHKMFYSDDGENNEIRVLIYNRDLCNKFLDEFGVARITGKEGKVPPIIFSLPKEQKWAFLQGYYHGDGSFRKISEKNSQVSIQTRSEELAYGIQILMMSLGYEAGVYRLRKRDMFVINLSKKKHIQAFLSGQFLNPIKSLPVKAIEDVEYEGYVYDPVDIEGHDFILASGVVSGNCCSYRFSTSIEADPDFKDKLNFKNGAHFSMGSFQVVTINIPRIAYRSKDLNECIQNIKSMMKKSMQIFYAKAYWMKKMKESNRMPFICQRPHDPACKSTKGPEAADLSALTYTFGIVGLEEAVQSLSSQKMEHSIEGWEMGLAIVSEMESYLEELEKESGFTLALARTPAETVAGRFAALDLMNNGIACQAMDVIKGDVEGCLAKIHAYGDTSTDQPVYYTNGTHIPVSANISLGKKAEREGAFFPILSGGNIMHIFLGEEAPNPKALMSFAFKLAKETPVGYFCFTRDFTICLDCDRISAGLKDECPLCRSKNVDHISRVTGYNQAVSGWNRAKQQELKDRMRYTL